MSFVALLLHVLHITPITTAMGALRAHTVCIPRLLQPSLNQVFSRSRIKNALRIRQNGSSKVFPSTINNQDLPRDKAGGVTEQENCCVGDISGISHATSGERPMVLARGALGHKAVRAFCPCDGTGCNDIRTYTMRTFFNCKNGRCRVYGSFRGGNMYLIRGTYGSGSDAVAVESCDRRTHPENVGLRLHGCMIPLRLLYEVEWL